MACCLSDSHLCLCSQPFPFNICWECQEKFQSAALCCLKRWDSNTRKPVTDPNALNLWMGWAGRTLTCLWVRGLCMILTRHLFADCSLSPTHCCPLSPLLTSTGQSSYCRWSWLSWNCRATFPVVLVTSCSISCFMTALLQDSWGCEDGCHLDAYLCSMLEFMTGAFVSNIFLWFRAEVFLQQKCLGSAKWGEIHRWVK